MAWIANCGPATRWLLMPDQVSISKSVARAFRVLELFREVREPLTAAEIGRRLTLPQPSTRALLKTLVELQYLAYTAADRRYRPTTRVMDLGRWLSAGRRLPAHLVRATDRVADLAGETASLCGLSDGLVEILHVRKAPHPIALQLEPGIGVAAWRTAAGRALLAALPDAEATSLLQGWQRQERSTAGRRVLQALPRELKRARTEAYFSGYDLFLKGVGAVCVVALPRSQSAPEGAPLVIAVAGPNDRIRPRELALLKIIRAELRRAGTPAG
jgi:IclR family pca regulon transcriptional regulator